MRTFIVTWLGSQILTDYHNQCYLQKISFFKHLMWGWGGRIHTRSKRKLWSKKNLILFVNQSKVIQIFKVQLLYTNP